MGRIKDLNSALPSENDAFAFDGANGTKKLSYAEFKQKLIDDGFGSGSSEAVVLTQAEYDSLPDEVKDSDTIFFISDAPFDLPNVVTCTSAEYAAMSDATKLDGRLYYVTDEEEVAKSLVVQNNVNSTETVPSSAVVYGLNQTVNDSLTPSTFNISTTHTNYLVCQKIGYLRIIYGRIVLTSNINSWSSEVFSIPNASDRPVGNNITFPINDNTNTYYLEVIYTTGSVQSSNALPSGTSLKIAGCWVANST